jgi:hypothetical protein
VADVHGDAETMAKALLQHLAPLGDAAVAPGAAAVAEPPKLVFLGDYIDRGEFSARCLREQASVGFTTIIGCPTCSARLLTRGWLAAGMLRPDLQGPAAWSAPC